jgi:hypothetical protein
MKQLVRSFPFAFILLCVLLMQYRCRDYPYYPSQLVPVYADSTQFFTIKIQAARPLQNTAKIYYKDSTIYIIERYQGIHIVDNRIPAQPKAIGFIQMYGCEDIAIKGNILYADNYTDLISVNIANPARPTVVSRISGVYPTTVEGKPAVRYREGYTTYQCPDST